MTEKVLVLTVGLWLAVMSGVWGEPKAAPMTGSRFIPNEFFGTTTHVNYAHQIVMLKDLNMRAVRTEWQWGALEPARHFSERPEHRGFRAICLPLPSDMKENQKISSIIGVIYAGIDRTMETCQG
jgi:hypothetical protein